MADVSRLQGLFSVATTSTKSPAVIRESIATVLSRIGVNHRPIKAGFECVHAPSIDLNSVAFSPRPDQPHEGATERSAPESPTLNRRRSTRRTGKMGLSRSPFSKDRELDKEASDEHSQASLPQSQQQQRDTTSSGSFTMLAANAVGGGAQTAAGSAPEGYDANSSAAAAGTAPTASFRSQTQIANSAMGDLPTEAGDMIVRFEIFIIRVGLLPGLHGIQFRRISGSAWQYSQLGESWYQLYTGDFC